MWVKIAVFWGLHYCHHPNPPAVFWNKPHLFTNTSLCSDSSKGCSFCNLAILYPATLQKLYTSSGIFSLELFSKFLNSYFLEQLWASDRCIFQSLLRTSFYFEYKGNHLHAPYVVLSPLKLGYLR